MYQAFSNIPFWDEQQKRLYSYGIFIFQSILSFKVNAMLMTFLLPFSKSPTIFDTYSSAEKIISRSDSKVLNLNPSEFVLPYFSKSLRLLDFFSSIHIYPFLPPPIVLASLSDSSFFFLPPTKSSAESFFRLHQTTETIPRHCHPQITCFFAHFGNCNFLYYGLSDIKLYLSPKLSIALPV